MDWGKVVTSGKDLPKGSVDLIVTAMEDQEMWSQERCQPWHRSATAWAEACRAPVLAIDPPPHAPAFEVKMTLVGGLPLHHHPPEAGSCIWPTWGYPSTHLQGGWHQVQLSPWCQVCNSPPQELHHLVHAICSIYGA